MIKGLEQLLLQAFFKGSKSNVISVNNFLRKDVVPGPTICSAWPEHVVSRYSRRSRVPSIPINRHYPKGSYNLIYFAYSYSAIQVYKKSRRFSEIRKLSFFMKRTDCLVRNQHDSSTIYTV
jgi:hypothetical protein